MFLLAEKRAVTSLVISASLDIQSLRKLLLGFVGIVSKMIFIPRRLQLWNPLCIQPGFDWLQRLTLHKGWYKLLVSSWNKNLIMFLLTDFFIKNLLLLVTNLSFMMITFHQFHQFPPPTPSLLGHGSKYLQHLCNCAQYVTLQKSFSHLTLVIYFYSNCTYTTKTRTANRWETTSSKLPVSIKLYSQSTAGVRACCVFFTNYLSKLCKSVGPKPFC